MKILLAGYYGRDDKCDDLLERAVQRMCRKDIEWIRIEDIAHHTDIDVAILGGGSLLGRGIYIIDNLIAWLKKNTNVPFHILGTGVRDTNLVSAKEQMMYLFNRAETAMVRGHTSRARLASVSIDVPRAEVGDPIFLLKHSLMPPSRTGAYIGGVLRGHPAAHEVLHILNGVSEQTGMPLQLFVFSKPQGDIGHDLGLRDTYMAIRNSYFWFGNRLHPFCIALNEGVPSIGMEIEFKKVEDVCSTLDYPFFIRNSSEFWSMYREFDIRCVETAMIKASKIRVRLAARLGEIVG